MDISEKLQLKQVLLNALTNPIRLTDQVMVFPIMNSKLSRTEVQTKFISQDSTSNRPRGSHIRHKSSRKFFHSDQRNIIQARSSETNNEVEIRHYIISNDKVPVE